jgi:hypothetical protein
MYKPDEERLVYREPPSKFELGLPDSYHVVAPIVLEYPKSWPESHGRNSAEIYSIK